jgi:hypothetical protein
MEFTKPLAEASPSPEEVVKIRQIIQERQLCGLANDTKWNHLITAMRQREGWRPSYRCKCVDGIPSYWDTEWWYHLPFPFMSVEWFDIGFLEETRRGRLIKPEITDHSGWIEALLNENRFDFSKGKDFFRIFGYSPKNFDLFEE